MSFADEIEVVHTVRDALATAWGYYHSGRLPQGADPPSLGQTHAIMAAFGELLASAQRGDEQGQRAAVLGACLGRGGVLPVFLNLGAHALSYAPEVLGTDTLLVDAFAEVRVHALQCLKSIVLLAADDAATASAATAALIETNVPLDLVQRVVASDMPEQVRVAACEVIFAFAFRLPSACQSLLVSGAAAGILALMGTEASPTVRLFLCSLLRLVVTEYPVEGASVAGLPQTFLHAFLHAEELMDVRVMAAEILTTVLKTPQCDTLVFEDATLASTVVATVREVLGDPAADPSLAEASARLVECLGVLAASTGAERFFELLLTMSVHAALCDCLRRPGPGVQLAAAAARALRQLVQWSPPTFHIGTAVMQHFPTLSAVLKTLMECEGIDAAADDSALHGQILAVELAITVSLMLAQSPHARSHINNELAQYPSWAGALLTALAKLLNAPTLDYYAPIEIVDITGRCVNNVDGVEWSAQGKPLKSSLRRLFSDQVMRVRSRTVDKAPAQRPASEPDAKNRARLTFVLLNFAVHLALDPAEAPESDAADVSGIHDQSTVVTSPSGSRRFPTKSDVSFRPPLSRAEKEEMMNAYDKFDSGFKLALRFARYYNKRERNEATYLPTADGYMVRQSQLKNPWAKIVKRPRVLSWGVQDVKEGDLFYFAIPYNDLSLGAVEAVAARLRKHGTTVRRLQVVTPHTAKGRRALLQDMAEHVLPATDQLLRQLAQLLDTHGESTVRFPVFLFREREVHVGERALHSGNLADVMEQVSYYFSQSAAERSAMHSNPQLTADIDRRIAELRSRTFTGAEAGAPDMDTEDDDVVLGRGHGDVSSDSDG